MVAIITDSQQGDEAERSINVDQFFCGGGGGGGGETLCEIDYVTRWAHGLVHKRSWSESNMIALQITKPKNL